MKLLKETGAFILFGLLLFVFDGILRVALSAAPAWIPSLLSVALVSILFYLFIRFIIKT